MIVLSTLCISQCAFAAKEKAPASRLEFVNSVDLGFGSTFSAVLHALNKYDKGSFSGIHINLDRGSFVDAERGPNWWDYYFEPIDFESVGAEVFMYERRQYLYLVNEGYRLSNARVQALVQKYVHLKPEMDQELEAFVADHFNGYYVIGVHHRGTDKVKEAQLVPFAVTQQKLEKTIAKLSQDQLERLRIFVATDEQDFLDLMAACYPDQVIYADFVRSTDDKPLHYSKDKYSSNYQKGKEAILDCYLLSRCDVLIFPASSSLSYFSSKLNPEQIVISVK